jgi:hypothetical protein
LCGTTRGRQVDEDFIQDDFNLCSLATQVTYYNYALGTWGGESRRGRGFDVRSALVPSLSGLRVALARPRGPCADTILDVDIPEGELDERQQELVEVSAETLYGLIHARFILTARGMHAMLSKYTDGAFGRCPRVYCNGQTVLPVGQSDVPRCSTVKIFCPMCFDLFFPYVCRRPSSTRRSRSGRKRPSSTDAAVPPAPLLATFPRPAGARLVSGMPCAVTRCRCDGLRHICVSQTQPFAQHTRRSVACERSGDVPPAAGLTPARGVPRSVLG